MLELIKRIVSYKAVSFIFRMFLGITFLYACYDKILHPALFAEAVANYRFLPSFLIGLVAVTLPWVELMCGLFLILGLFVRSSALVASLLFSVFFVGLTSAVLRGIDINCGCFSVTNQGHSVDFSYILRDLGYLVLSIHVLFLDKGFLSLPTLLKRPSSDR